MNIFNTIKKDAPDFSFIILENKSTDQGLGVVQFDSSSQRLKSVGTIHTTLEMNNLMSTALELISGPSPSGIYFAPDFPEFLLPLDNPGYKAAPQVVPKVITWSNVRKEPGTMSGTPFAGTQEIKLRFREYIAIFGDSSKKFIISTSDSTMDTEAGLIGFIKIKAQAFDNLVQYNIWTKSNYEAESLMEWFEEFMENYTGMFREAGIVQMYMNRRVRDETMVQMKNGYHVRSVLYYVRTERVKIETFSPIKRINLDVTVSTLLNTVNSLDNQLITDSNAYYNTIVNKWVNKS